MAEGAVRRGSGLLLLLCGSLAVLACAPLVGMVVIDPLAAIRGTDATSSYVLWQLRIPRVLLAYSVGAALAIGGVIFQALFRNLLATPFTLGVSSGAALGAALYIKFGLVVTALGLVGNVGASFLGAVLTIAVVYLLGRRGKLGERVSLLLAGVVMSFFFSSLILFLQYMSDFAELYRISHWLMGRLDVVGYQGVAIVMPFAVAGFFVAFVYARNLNLLTVGDELAATRGVRIRQTRVVFYLTVSLMVAAVVAVCGVIGFIGVIVPYYCRLLIGAEHRRLLPAAALLGGAFLVVCDTVARTVIAPVEIPAGVITALAGAPLFIWLLITSRLPQQT